MVFGIIVAAAGILIAYKRNIIQQQVLFVLILALLETLFVVIRSVAAWQGMSSDVIGIVLATILELFIGRLYPWIIAPFIALGYSLLKQPKLYSRTKLIEQ